MFRFDILEALEIGSQIYQVHSSSWLVAVPWPNSLSVAFIMLSCWSTPVARYFCRRVGSRMTSRSNSGRKGSNTAHLESSISTCEARMLCLAADLALDVGSSVIVPVLIFALCDAKFDKEAADFPRI